MIHRAISAAVAEPASQETLLHVQRYQEALRRLAVVTFAVASPVAGTAVRPSKDRTHKRSGWPPEASR